MRFKNNMDLVLILVFLVTITIPSIRMLTTPIQRESLVENRNLARVPRITSNIPFFITATEDFLNDHFGFRETFIKYNNWFTYFVLDTSTDNRVVVGRDDWLFYNILFNGIYMLDDYQGIAPELSLEQLERFRERLEETRDELQAQEIVYYFVITPDKQSIYSNYLSDDYRQEPASTWLDQIIEYMTIHSDIEIIDLRPQMLAVAQSNPNQYYYYPVGTHWTSDGAWVGYEVLMENMQDDFPNLQMVERNRFAAPEEIGDHDLVNFAGLSDWKDNFTLLPDYDEAINPCADVIEIPESNDRWGDTNYLIYQGCDNAHNPQTILIFRDSFSSALVPFFSETFETTAFMWRPYSFEIAQNMDDDIHLDIVIEQWVERRLIQFLNE